MIYMKKIIIKCVCVLSIIVGFSACEMDNLEAPDAGITGTIYDQNGVPLQLEQGKGSGHIRMTELSYKDKAGVEVVTPQELNLQIDGTFRNEKLFAGTYLMHPFKGPFYPLDSTEMKTVELKKGSVTNVDFTVTPYLEIEWVGEPEIVQYGEGEHPNGKPAGKYFKASAKFKMIYKDGAVHPGVLAGTFCVSNTQFASASNRIGDYYGTDFSVTNALEGETITFVAQRSIEFYGQDYYFRIGFKCKDQDQKFNYTTIKKMTVGLDLKN